MKVHRVLASCILIVAFAALCRVAILPAVAVAEHHDSQREVKRIGMVIGIKPDQIHEYKRLHADNYAGVRDLLTQANMHNFSIFMHQLDDGNTYLFGYYEYTGDDFEADMRWLAGQPRNKEWLAVTDAMQQPLQGNDGWATMKQVYYND